ncbi:MAG: ParB/RepB/Spo0J family partition protein [Deltaproteobacteria bacterium]|nr:ParB/RepB/Spo0J family partition protein [Deltaproteobacteria bacterium]
MDDGRVFGPKKRGLGRGLGALIPTVETPKGEKRSFFYVGIEEVQPNPLQPRKKVKEASIDQLAESIKEKGIIQPLLVRKIDDGYELIAGERRWRAAQRAGLTEVPVLIREAEPTAQLELALIENIQRQNLNPMEEAEAYQRLIQEFGISQEEVGRRVGKDRSSVANILRLLKLSPWVQEKISEGAVSFGHAKCLLALESPQEQIRLAKEIIEKGISVRELERIMKKGEPAQVKKGRLASLAEEDWVKEMIQKYKTRIKLKRKKKGGALEIYFHSEEELIRIVDLMMPK